MTGPETTVAVLGGGQLGWMLGLAGIPLGLEFRFLDPSPDAPAQALGPLVVGALDDESALRKVAKGAGLATFEWEGVPAASARLVADTVPVMPSPVALEVAQDRLAEKEMFLRLGIPTAGFAAVEGLDELWAAIADVGLPAVLKTRRGGYDGKLQAVLRAPDDVEEAWSGLPRVPLIVEERVEFEREVSVVAVRGFDGAIRCWPVVANVHRDGILRLSRAPTPGLTDELQALAEAISARVVEALEYVGVLAIELFEVDGELFANELAPRVHNSGHWTIEGAVTSQFENHLRAIVGWPLGSTAARGVSAMVNCIGALPDVHDVLAVPGAHLHDYRKAPRRARKLGHVTITAPDVDTLDERLAQLLPHIPSDG
jgi:5-(carboxyamino)imidazole ribonucleotide synthase